MSETLGDLERDRPAPAPDAGAGAPGAAASCRHWSGHVIVCGLAPVGLRAVGQLGLAGAQVVVLADEFVSEHRRRIVRDWDVPIVDRGADLSEALFEAGVAGARAVICIESTDLRTLETALLVRDLRAEVRVIAIERRDGGPLEHPPRRDTRLAAGDQTYLAGPSEELLRVLRREHGL